MIVNLDSEFFQYSIEELEGMLDHPEELETGCEYNCEACQDRMMSEIEAVLKIKKNDVQRGNYEQN